MSELLEQFLAEGQELVEAAAGHLLALEREPGDQARLDGAFRAVHTLKGAAALFDLAPMESALHAAEDLLAALRDGGVPVGRASLDPLLALVGASEDWLAAIARTGVLPEAAAERGRALEQALRAAQAAPAAAGPARPAAPPDWLPALLAAEAAAVAAAQAAGQGLVALRYAPAPDCFFLGDDPLALVRAVPALVALRLLPRAPWPATGPEPFTCNLVIELLSRAPEAELRQVFRLVADQVAMVPLAARPPAPEGRGAEPAARGLRVDAARVDALLDLAGELIVAKNALAGLVPQATAAEPRLGQALAERQVEIDRLAQALHRAVMGLRMVPLARTFRRLPRLVREAASALGKPVALELHGEAVEADRAIVDGLFDPLLHLLRNAVDHGIEAPEARAAAGKPAGGRIRLEARREGEGLVVEVADDGRGFDPARLRQVALRRGLLTEAALAGLSDEAVLQLVFRPGFSTAAEVSALSGRGVGMDAVRAAAEALGGRVTLATRPGAGSTLRLLLPGGAAVASLLLVRLGEEVFGIPVEAVAETARIPADRILPLPGGEAFVLRDRTLPLLRLAALLGLPAAPRGTRVPVLVTGAGEARVAVEVDGFAGRAEVLLRPPAGLMAAMPGLLGAALLGDGRVHVVLDLAELIG